MKTRPFLDFLFEAENVAINVVFMQTLDSYCVRVGSLNVGTVTGRGRELGG